MAWSFYNSQGQLLSVGATGAAGADGAPGADGTNTVIVQEEGVPLATAADTLDFVGAGVTASGVGATKTITIPGDTAPGTPALTLGTTNATGAAATPIATDATIAAFDATAPVTQAYGDAAATGAAGVAARRDHKHGMPAAGLADQGIITYLDGTVAAAPATPGAGKLRIYAKTGPALAVKDDAGNETVLGAGGGGSVATDAIWDAAGDLAVGSGANTAAKLAAGSEDDVLTIVSGVPAWAAPAGGGGSTLPLDNVTAGSGDLFGGTTLDGGWTSLQTTALTSVDRTVDGYCILKNSGNTSGADRGIQRAFAPAGDFTITARIEFATLGTNYEWVGIFAGGATPGDGVGGKRIETMIVHNGGIHWKYAKFAAGSETAVFDLTPGNMGPLQVPAQQGGIFPFWLRLKRVGSTLTAGLSWDGVQFVDSGTTTTIDFTVETCGIFIAEATATSDIRATFDFIATTG